MQDPICGMSVSEKSSLRLTVSGQTYYFCSEHCLKKFASQNKVDADMVSSCAGSTSLPWYKNKTLLTAAILLLLYVSSYFLPILGPFKQSLTMYFQKAWWAIALGLILGGIIDYLVPREYISYVLARRKKRTIVYSVMLGFLMSVCNHGILAISMELYKKGASTSAVIAFLLASPWANLPITLMLIGFFGFLKAIYIIVVAIIIALVTGYIYQFLERRQLVETNSQSLMFEEDFSIMKDIQKRWSDVEFSSDYLKETAHGIYGGVVALSNMVLWWILIGIGIASFAGAYIPPHFFHQYMGPTVLGLVVTLIMATILEVCSEGTAPLAFEIFRQTGALGNSLVFLMAGVATDYTEIGLIWHNIGRRAALWLPAITVPQIILFGILANIIF